VAFVPKGPHLGGKTSQIVNMRKRRSSPRDPPPKRGEAVVSFTPKAPPFTVAALLKFLPDEGEAIFAVPPEIIEDRRENWARGVEGFRGDLEAVRVVLSEAARQELGNIKAKMAERYWADFEENVQPLLRQLKARPDLLGLLSYNSQDGKPDPHLVERISELIKVERPPKRKRGQPRRSWIREARKKLYALGIRSDRKRDFLLSAIGL